MTDRFSMAHSLEARTPFLDRVFVEKMLAIPAVHRTRSGNLKYLLKESVRDLLPEELLHTRKRGFVVPVSRWLRGQLKPQVEEFLGPGFLRRQAIFRESIYDRLVRPHMEGRRDYGQQLWTLLMFQLWFKEAAGS